MKKINVAFIGNPNCGKTTLFNVVTGSRLKVANWPGVTVEKKEGRAFYEERELVIVDTPGIYSLTSYTIEEQVTRKCALDDDIDVIVNVADASNLEKSLYLTLQLLELGKPVLLALNMMDVVRDRGMEIDLHRLPEMLGNIPVIPVSASKKQGIDILLHAIVHHYEEGPHGQVLTYSAEIEDKIEKLEVMLEAHYPNHANRRWHGIKLLEWDEEVQKEHPISVVNVADKSYEKEIIQTKYAYIEEIVEEVVINRSRKMAATDKVDQILTHPFWGMIIFLFILGTVFFLTFNVGDLLKGVLEIGLEYFSNMVSGILQSIGTSEWLMSLVVDGIIAGVGGILTFLPNIAMLFLALAILEDSGYMARVAYVCDSLMGRAGLSGKAFLPMILGFGCTVPAIMATRALETEKDRRKTMIVTPFMSCSAKLPIYILFADLFFGKYAALVSLSMYATGVIFAIVTALVVRLFEKKKTTNSLLIELPEYKKPNMNSIWIYVWNKLKDYLTKAGTTIFLASVAIWFLLNFGPAGMSDSPAESFGAIIGSWMVPVLKPIGLGMWQVGVALLSGISAKEVVVSSFAVLFGTANTSSKAGMQVVMDNLQSGIPGFGPWNALSLMVFCLLYVPCVATIVTIRRESRSLAFTIKLLTFQMLVAYCSAFLVFQLGQLLG